MDICGKSCSRNISFCLSAVSHLFYHISLLGTDTAVFYQKIAVNVAQQFFLFCELIRWARRRRFLIKKNFFILADPSQLTLKPVRLIIPPSQLILFRHAITFVGVIVDYCFVSFLVIWNKQFINQDFHRFFV